MPDADYLGDSKEGVTTMQSTSAARLAKLCTGLLVIGVLAIVAYEILTEAVDGPNAAVLAEGSASSEQADFASGSPNALAFGEADDQETTSETGGDKTDGKETVRPKLTISEPADGSRHNTKNVVFEGSTEPGTTVFTGPYKADVDEEGNWRIALVLSPGANGAKISARDSAGNVSEASITVWYDNEAAPKPPTTEPAIPAEPVDVEFSANQKYGTCEEELAYDKFWGTATPNSALTITSPYGGAELEVDEYGNWEQKVFFPDAPRDQEFTVTVTAVNGSKAFSFTSLTPPAPLPIPD